MNTIFWNTLRMPLSILGLLLGVAGTVVVSDSLAITNYTEATFGLLIVVAAASFSWLSVR